MSAKEQFNAKVKELIRQARSMPPEIRKRVIELLNEARGRIIAAIADVDPASFQAAQMRALAQSIDRALNQVGQQITQVVNAAQTASFQLGQAQVGQPLAAAGIPGTPPAPSFAGVSTQLLAIAQGYTADLISGLSKDAAGKLNAAIQRAFLGGQSVPEVIQQVGRAINGGKEFNGFFSEIGERATTIATNEILRVHSMAAQARLEDLAANNPAIQKKWVHVPAARVPRITHLMADGQIRDVDKPFLVGGEELMYPRDPNGTPRNTINCHCVLVPAVSEDALRPSEAQEKALKDLGIEIVAGS